MAYATPAPPPLHACLPKGHGLSKLKYLRRLLFLVFDSSFGRVVQFVTRTMKSSKASAQGYQAQGAAATAHDALDRLHLIQAPTLVLVGTNDRLLRTSSSGVIASKIPQAKTVEIKGGSHDMCIEKSKEFNTQVMAFLQSE